MARTRVRAGCPGVIGPVPLPVWMDCRGDVTGPGANCQYVYRDEAIYISLSPPQPRLRILSAMSTFPPMSPRWLLLPALLSASVAGAGEAVYRWVDAKGEVHFSDQAHAPAGASAMGIRVPPPESGALADLQIQRNADASSDVYVTNRLGGPVELSLAFTDASNVQALPSLPLRQVVGANQRVLVSRIQARLPGQAAGFALGMSTLPGDPAAMPRDVVYSLPVDETSDWHLGQEFHGGFSHNDEQNQYAVDLVVPEGTPVLAARSGVVMQVESGFDRAGLDRQKFAGRANLIRVLHDDGSMAIYAHLQENGAYVRVGDRIGIGQVIGASGNTGYSSGPHLHFCVQVNRGMRLVSIPFRMIGPGGFLPLPGR